MAKISDAVTRETAMMLSVIAAKRGEGRRVAGVLVWRDMVGFLYLVVSSRISFVRRIIRSYYSLINIGAFPGKIPTGTVDN